MMRILVSSMLALSLVLIATACSQTAPPPAPAPTVAPKPAAPAPAAAPAVAPAPAPTKAPAPTAVPAKKVDFPKKGKQVTLIVGYAPGGPSDGMARVLAPFLEKELGAPVVVVNKPGASSQVGTLEMVKSEPDGHTIATMNLPTTLNIYLDKDRDAGFARKDLALLSAFDRQPSTVLVKNDSPMKTLKDLVDAAKDPSKRVRAGSTGLMSVQHLAILELEQLAGVKFTVVHFDGTGPTTTALLGGHIDAMWSSVNPGTMGVIWGGEARSLGVMSHDPHPLLPGVGTYKEQGYPMYVYVTYCWAAPVGVPEEVLGVLRAAMDKVALNPEFKQQMEKIGLSVNYLNAKDLDTFWAQSERTVAPLLELAKQK